LSALVKQSLELRFLGGRHQQRLLGSGAFHDSASWACSLQLFVLLRGSVFGFRFPPSAFLSRCPASVQFSPCYSVSLRKLCRSSFSEALPPSPFWPRLPPPSGLVDKRRSVCTRRQSAPSIRTAPLSDPPIHCVTDATCPAPALLQIV
jgi:hypothetical protein